MVHYDPTAAAPQTPPVLCPKCGSHRTEVVGKSLDDSVLVIRCNACGERSEIANPAHGEDTAATGGVVPMKGFIVGGDLRRRMRAGLMQA